MAALVLMLAGFLVPSCSTDRDTSELFAPDDVGTLVIDALLTVGTPMPAVSLRRVLSLEESYSRAAAAVSGATVTITERGGQPIDYIESGQPGVYRLGTVSRPNVKPNTTYDLTVRTAEGETLRSTTTTPPPFAVDEWLLLSEDGTSIRRRLSTWGEVADVFTAPENQLTYADGLLEARFERPDVPAFEIGIFSLDLASDFVIDPEFFDDEDFEDLTRQVSSPPLEALDGRVRLPWFAIFFEGRYKLKAFALDKNAFDLVRSVPDEGGGFAFGGTFGDNFERPIFHVEGGIGLFGSVSVDSVGFTIHPRD